MLKKRDWSRQARRALGPAEIVSRLAALTDWRLTGDAGDAGDVAIEKTYRFANWHETIAFVNAVAFVATAQDHHPDLAVHFSRCVVRFHTHDVKGLSETDFECAATIDALLA